MDTDTSLTHDLLVEEPERAAVLRDHLREWWDQYAGRPGSLPDPMLTTLETGPAYSANPSHDMDHLRSTGRGDQADDVRSRLQVATGTSTVWWESPETSFGMGGRR